MSFIQKKSHPAKATKIEEKIKEAAQFSQQNAALNSPNTLCGNSFAMARKPYSPVECKALLAGFLDGVEFAGRLSGREAFINGEFRAMLGDLDGHLRRLESIDAAAVTPSQGK